MVTRWNEASTYLAVSQKLFGVSSVTKFPPYNQESDRSMYFRVRLPLYHHISCFCLLLAQPFCVSGAFYCSASGYGNPDYGDCLAALSTLPSTVADQWFLEQQVRTELPTADWQHWVDSRPPALRQPLAQLPKWWSHR